MRLHAARLTRRLTLVLGLLTLAACEGELLPPESDRAGGQVNGRAGGQASDRGPHVPSGMGSATLSWQPPTERLDASPLAQLSGYRILYGQRSQDYSYAIDLDKPELTRYFIDGLGEGQWYFAIVAIDADGLESPPSAEVSKRI